MHVRQPMSPTLELECQLRMANSQLLKDGCLQIMNVDRALGEVMFVGLQWIARGIGDVVAV